MARVVASTSFAFAIGATLVACELRTSGLFDPNAADASTSHDSGAGAPGDDDAAGGNGGDDAASDGAIDGNASGDGGALDGDASASTGALSVTVVQNSPTTVDLPQLGPIDWVHWGLQDATSVDRKSPNAGVISGFVPIGTSTVFQLTDDITKFAWENGAPTQDESGTTTAVYVEGTSAGFSLDVAAGTATRTLTLYIGGWKSDGSLVAQLSDQSAPDQTASPTSDHGANWYATVTIAFRASVAGQHLSLRWTCTGDYAGVFSTGNVSLRAAAVE